jgi:hypothetical protein
MVDALNTVLRGYRLLVFESYHSRIKSFNEGFFLTRKRPAARLCSSTNSDVRYLKQIYKQAWLVNMYSQKGTEQLKGIWVRYRIQLITLLWIRRLIFYIWCGSEIVKICGQTSKKSCRTQSGRSVVGIGTLPPIFVADPKLWNLWTSKKPCTSQRRQRAKLFAKSPPPPLTTCV